MTQKNIEKEAMDTLKNLNSIDRQFIIGQINAMAFTQKSTEEQRRINEQTKAS